MSAGLGGAPQLGFGKGNQFLDLTSARSAPNVAFLHEIVPDCSPSPGQSCLLAAVQCSAASSFLLEPWLMLPARVIFPFIYTFFPTFCWISGAETCRSYVSSADRLHLWSLSASLSLASSTHSSCFLACGTKIAGHCCCYWRPTPLFSTSWVSGPLYTLFFF